MKFLINFKEHFVNKLKLFNYEKSTLYDRFSSDLSGSGNRRAGKNGAGHFDEKDEDEEKKDEDEEKNEGHYRHVKNVTVAYQQKSPVCPGLFCFKASGYRLYRAVPGEYPPNKICASHRLYRS